MCVWTECCCFEGVGCLLTLAQASATIKVSASTSAVLSLWTSPFIKQSRQDESTLGNGCTCACTHVPSFILRYTHAITFSTVAKALTTRLFTNANTRTWGVHLKERFDDTSSIITTFGLKDYVFFGRGVGWGELNGIPSPRGKAKAEQCWNKWFMLLSSQVNSTAFQLSVHQFSRREVKKITKATLGFSFLCLTPTWWRVIRQISFFQLVFLWKSAVLWVSQWYTKVGKVVVSLEQTPEHKKAVI